MLKSFFIVLSFISILPVPQKFLYEWQPENLRFFCLCLPFAGIIFGLSWPIIFYLLSLITQISDLFRGFIFMFFTLSLTGGIHLDGLMDTCDAVFSYKDRASKIKILSDTHTGSFAVIGCVVILGFTSFLFSEFFRHSNNIINLFVIPVYSRLGMGILLNNLPFAKSDGMAVILGSSRTSKDNIFFALIFVILILLSFNLIPFFFVIILLIWGKICIKIFGGITGDLLGAFVEISEIFMLTGAVIEICI